MFCPLIFTKQSSKRQEGRGHCMLVCPHPWKDNAELSRPGVNQCYQQGGILIMIQGKIRYRVLLPSLTSQAKGAERQVNKQQCSNQSASKRFYNKR
jgi:hypothetical protein